eukprot:c19652_g2_i1.p1 GENE.c19652_g2_i1~~c19652_g2_i1.p1  ORF type:complete len:442 (+),score=93.62 c19652_g2_i1:44-1327(+)
MDEARARAVLAKFFRSLLLRRRFRRIVLAYLRHPDSQNLRNRNNCLRELFATETTYVEGLRLLVECVREPMLAGIRAGKLDMTVDDVNIIFNVLPTIYQLHKNFHDDLTKEMEKFPKTRMCQHFKTYAPFMKSYFEFCNKFPESNQKINELTSKPSLKKFFHEAQKNCNNQPLPSLMITLIQRVPRYGLLLAEVQRYTPASHSELKTLNEAFVVVNEVAQYLNTKKRKAEAQAQLVTIHTRLQNFPSLLSPAREFIRQAVLRVAMSQNGKRLDEITKLKERFVLLFNDMILIASEASEDTMLGSLKRTFSRRKSFSGEACLASNENTEMRVRMRVWLEDATLEYLTAHPLFPAEKHLVKYTTSDGRFLFFCFNSRQASQALLFKRILWTRKMLIIFLFLFSFPIYHDRLFIIHCSRFLFYFILFFWG